MEMPGESATEKVARESLERLVIFQALVEARRLTKLKMAGAELAPSQEDLAVAALALGLLLDDSRKRQRESGRKFLEETLRNAPPTEPDKPE